MNQASPKTTQKLAQLECKRNGTPVTLTWREYATAADVDPTTGAYTNLPGTLKSLDFKAFWHTVQPVKTGTRLFGEIESGDGILDVVIPILKVTDAGDTTLTVGQVLTQFTFNAANNALDEDLNQATATALVWESLIEPAFTINGEKWVMKERGEHLKEAWDATVGGVQIAQSILLRKAT